MSKEGRWALGGLAILAIWTFAVLPFLKLWQFDSPFWTKALEDPAAYFTAGFTAVLALSTILLWFATRAVAVASKDSARVAEKALVNLEAPFISIEIIDNGLKRKQHEIGHDFHQLMFVLANYGRAPARTFDLVDKIVVTKRDELPPS
jgi:hypothetical protein